MGLESRGWTRLAFAATVLALTAVSGPGLAQQVNGCGSGWNQPLVPDGIRPLNCVFKPACDRHDVCYGKCLPGEASASSPHCQYLRCTRGGDLFKRPICDTDRFKEFHLLAASRRDICDAQFLADLRELNPERSQCRLFVLIYPAVVRVLGASAFAGIDGAQGASWSVSERRQYADAINAMLTQWSPSRLAQLEDQLRSGKALVDFSRPLAFDPERGLYNSR